MSPVDRQGGEAKRPKPIISGPSLSHVREVAARYDPPPVVERRCKRCTCDNPERCPRV